MQVPQIILQITSDSAQTVSNFQRYALYIMETLKLENIVLCIEPIINGAIVIFSSASSYREFHKKVELLLKNLPKREIEHIIHNQKFDLIITPLMLMNITREECEKLIYKSYKFIYPDCSMEKTEKGLILHISGKESPELSNIMK